MAVERAHWPDRPDDGAIIGDFWSVRHLCLILPVLVLMPVSEAAMPSLHVDRRLRIAFTILAVLVLLGSAHLGWHYPIDGYLAIFATWAIWRAVGWLLDRPGVAHLLWGRDDAMVAVQS